MLAKNKNKIVTNIFAEKQKYNMSKLFNDKQLVLYCSFAHLFDKLPRPGVCVLKVKLPHVTISLTIQR